MNQITVIPPAARQVTLSTADIRPVVFVLPQPGVGQVEVKPVEQSVIEENFETLAQNLKALPKVIWRDEMGRIDIQDFGNGQVIKRMVRDEMGRIQALALTGTLLGPQVWTKVLERDTSGRLQGAHYTVGQA